MSKPVPTDSNTTLQEIKETIVAYQLERGWDKLRPRDLAMSISIEAAELLEHFQWGDEDSVPKGDMADEVADILTYLVEFALAKDIDITSAFSNKLERVKQKYPPTLINPDNKSNEMYYKIKKSHRKGKSQSGQVDQ